MSEKIFAYVSSWSHGEGASGLYLYTFDPEIGALSLVRQLDDKTEFAVSSVDRERGILYIVDESANLPGLRTSGGGRVFAFRIDPETGDLEQLSCMPTFCANPSYVTPDASGKYLVVSNHAGRNCVTKVSRDAFGKFHMSVEYDDSTVDLFALNEDGSIGELVDVAKHEGSGPDFKFQANPHPHCAIMSPSGKLFAVCDKGNDHVYLYSIDRNNNRLTLESAPYVCPPGSRPRFCAFHPTLPYFYHNNEGRSDMDAYRYDETGRLEFIGSFGLKTEENAAVSGVWEQQDMRIDQKGEYLYTLVSNPATVVVYKVDQDTGALNAIQNLKLDGERARACALSPDGRFLLVACTRSGKVFTLAVGEDGTLTHTDVVTDQPCAAFITFYQP